MRLLRLVPLVAAVAIVAACNQPAPASSSVIEVDDAFIVRPANGRDISGAGFTVTVQGEPLSLVGASSDIADRTEIHTMSMNDGMMQMRQVDALPVTESEPLVLERGGNHLMLFGVTDPLTEGETVDLSLTFRDAAGKEQVVVTEATVVGPGG